MGILIGKNNAGVPKVLVTAEGVDPKGTPADEDVIFSSDFGEFGRVVEVLSLTLDSSSPEETAIAIADQGFIPQILWTFAATETISGVSRTTIGPIQRQLQRSDSFLGGEPQLAFCEWEPFVISADQTNVYVNWYSFTAGGKQPTPKTWPSGFLSFYLNQSGGPFIGKPGGPYYKRREPPEPITVIIMVMSTPAILP